MSDLRNSEIPNRSIDKFIDGIEEIFADIRERHVDDSVCGLCEYDGAYIGQSGDWCNECPGFNRDDCFKLSDRIREKWTDEIIKALPSAQQYMTATSNTRMSNTVKIPVMDGTTERLPSAQPERKTGKWIKELDRKYHWHCSECGYVIGLSKMDSRYCLNCGAKMEEVDDE